MKVELTGDLGGDCIVGRPTSLHLASERHDVHIFENPARPFSALTRAASLKANPERARRSVVGGD